MGYYLKNANKRNFCGCKEIVKKRMMSSSYFLKRKPFMESLMVSIPIAGKFQLFSRLHGGNFNPTHCSLFLGRTSFLERTAGGGRCVLQIRTFGTSNGSDKDRKSPNFSKTTNPTRTTTKPVIPSPSTSINNNKINKGINDNKDSHKDTATDTSLLFPGEITQEKIISLLSDQSQATNISKQLYDTFLSFSTKTNFNFPITTANIQKTGNNPFQPFSPSNQKVISNKEFTGKMKKIFHELKNLPNHNEVILHLVETLLLPNRKRFMEDFSIFNLIFEHFLNTRSIDSSLKLGNHLIEFYPEYFDARSLVLCLQTCLKGTSPDSSGGTSLSSSKQLSYLEDGIELYKQTLYLMHSSYAAKPDSAFGQLKRSRRVTGQPRTANHPLEPFLKNSQFIETIFQLFHQFLVLYPKNSDSAAQSTNKLSYKQQVFQIYDLLDELYDYHEKVNFLPSELFWSEVFKFLGKCQHFTELQHWYSIYQQHENEKVLDKTFAHYALKVDRKKGLERHKKEKKRLKQKEKKDGLNKTRDQEGEEQYVEGEDVSGLGNKLIKQKQLQLDVFLKRRISKQEKIEIETASTYIPQSIKVSLMYYLALLKCSAVGPSSPSSSTINSPADSTSSFPKLTKEQLLKELPTFEKLPWIIHRFLFYDTIKKLKNNAQVADYYVERIRWNYPDLIEDTRNRTRYYKGRGEGPIHHDHSNPTPLRKILSLPNYPYEYQLAVKFFTSLLEICVLEREWASIFYLLDNYLAQYGPLSRAVFQQVVPPSLFKSFKNNQSSEFTPPLDLAIARFILLLLHLPGFQEDLRKLMEESKTSSLAKEQLHFYQQRMNHYEKMVVSENEAILRYGKILLTSKKVLPPLITLPLSPEYENHKRHRVFTFIKATELLRFIEVNAHYQLQNNQLNQIIHFLTNYAPLPNPSDSSSSIPSPKLNSTIIHRVTLDDEFSKIIRSLSKRLFLKYFKPYVQELSSWNESNGMNLEELNKKKHQTCLNQFLTLFDWLMEYSSLSSSSSSLSERGEPLKFDNESFFCVFTRLLVVLWDQQEFPKFYAYLQSHGHSFGEYFSPLPETIDQQSTSSSPSPSPAEFSPAPAFSVAPLSTAYLLNKSHTLSNKIEIEKNYQIPVGRFYFLQILATTPRDLTEILAAFERNGLQLNERDKKILHQLQLKELQQQQQQQQQQSDD